MCSYKNNNAFDYPPNRPLADLYKKADEVLKLIHAEEDTVTVDNNGFNQFVGNYSKHHNNRHYP